MTINGVEILQQTTIYNPTTFAYILGTACFILTLIFGIHAFASDTPELLIPTIIFFILGVIIISVNDSNLQNVLTKPSKIQYTIEIIDDNAWKELGPNYTVIKKPYDNKEIYIIEGDYNV